MQELIGTALMIQCSTMTGVILTENSAILLVKNYRWIGTQKSLLIGISTSKYCFIQDMDGSFTFSHKVTVINFIYIKQAKLFA